MKKETLKKLSDALNEKVYSKIDYLHCGGCGFAALALIDALQKLGEEARLVSRNGYGHLLVEVKVEHGKSLRKVVMDCSMAGYEWDYRYGYADVKQLKRDLRYDPNWNDAFDRSNLPKMRRAIRKVVDDVLKPCTELV